MSTWAICAVTVLYFYTAYDIGASTGNWWWTLFWGSYGMANVGWIKATGAL